MSGLVDKRKRSREDEVCDSAHPLSKRINNLHLNNFEESGGSSSSSSSLAQHSSSSNNIAKQQQHNHSSLLNGFNKTTTPLDLGVDDGHGGGHHHHNGGAEHMHNMYSPELSEAQNPFYYDKNKLLHALHLERLKRCPV